MVIRSKNTLYHYHKTKLKHFYTPYNHKLKIITRENYKKISLDQKQNQPLWILRGVSINLSCKNKPQNSNNVPRPSQCSSRIYENKTFTDENGKGFKSVKVS